MQQLDKHWWKKSTVYQIYPRSFMDSNGDGIGDIPGIISKLDYLQFLGVDVVWISPFFKSPMDDNGYDVSDYQDIHEEFGTMEDLEELLEQMHARGMKLVIDLVLNHTSDEHPWFLESRSSKDNPKRDWYIWRDGLEGDEPNNWASIFGGSAWEYDMKTKEYFLHLFTKRQPDLNWENKEVRSALYDMVNWWLDKGVDGFRIDAIAHIKKEAGLPNLDNPDGLQWVPSFDMQMNRPGIEDFLNEFADATFRKRNVMTVGEASGVSVEGSDIWVYEDGGFCDMIFQFEQYDIKPRDEAGVMDVLGIKHVLTNWQTGLEGKAWNALFLENHDKPRSISKWGNDREYWQECAKAFALMYFMMKGTPYIYQGQELGMTNIYFKNIEDYQDVAAHNDYKHGMLAGVSEDELLDKLALNSRDNSRTPMQWSADVNGGFSSGEPWLKVNSNYTWLNVENQLKDEHSVFSFYRRMIELRSEYAVLQDGVYEVIDPNHRQVYAYSRNLEKETMYIVVNLTPENATWKINDNRVGSGRALLSNYAHPLEITRDGEVLLKPFEARMIYVME